MKIKISKNTSRGFLMDFSFLFMVFFTIAFHDKKNVVVASQLFFIAIQGIGSFDHLKFYVSGNLKNYLFWYGSFFIYCALSYIWSINRTTYKSYLFSVLQVLIIGVGVVLYLNSLERFEKAVTYLILSAVVLCVRMIISVPSNAWGSERVGQYIGYGNVSVTYSLSYIAIFSFYRGISKKRKVFTVISIIIMFFSALSGSKKAIFIAIISVFLIYYLNRNNRSNAVGNIGKILIVFIMGYFLFSRIPVLYNAVGKRVVIMIRQLLGSSYDGSTYQRIQLMKYALAAFAEHPILGIGLDAFRYSNPIGKYSHNNYTEMLVCYGLTGFFLYYSYVIKELLGFMKKMRKKPELIIGFIVLLNILIMDVGSVSYAVESIHIIIVICLCFYNLVSNNGNVSKSTIN